MYRQTAQPAHFRITSSLTTGIVKIQFKFLIAVQLLEDGHSNLQLLISVEKIALPLQSTAGPSKLWMLPPSLVERRGQADALDLYDAYF